jgi:Ca2+-binding EF-hand superfamily protein
MNGKMATRLLGVASAMMLGGMLAAQSPAHAQAAADPIQAFDTDKDGTLDWNEVQTAASALFDKLDKDADGTLDKKEVVHRISSGAFDKADPDKDGTLSKDEYLKLTEQRFKAADSDHDGTLSAAELKTHAGKLLLLLLQ